MIDNLARIPLDAIRVFEATARLNSFTRAAEALGMTQAAVSWRIRDLEQRLGVALFVRETRRIALTLEGQRLASASSEALNLMRRAINDVMEQDQSVLGITTLQTLATQWLATRIGMFQLANPDLAVKIDVDNGLSDFSDHGTDIGLRFGSGQWPGLESRFLIPALFTPLCSPELQASLDIRTPADLKSAPLVGLPQEWAEWFARVGMADDRNPPPPRVVSENQAMEVATAIAGQGIALGNPVFYAREIANGQLVRLFDESVSLGGGYWLSYPKERRSVPKIARFRDWVLEMARTDPANIEACRASGMEVGTLG
ncbi:LysR substrate-binding domain-containing protein [Brevundimonas sp. BH3]|uniref:LysR substrate-binding domain-containing protein n=1 Tax=Brevundimonas sp. BH3 TaxID=3133089 RepID=UPI003253C439